MTAKLIKGTEIREEILSEIEEEVKKIKDEHGVVPGLVTILVGENPASISYVTLKIKTAKRFDLYFTHCIYFPYIVQIDYYIFPHFFFVSSNLRIFFNSFNICKVVSLTLLCFQLRYSI